MPTAEAVDHKVVSHEQWVKARKEFLAKEKEFTHAREAMAEKLRELPWEKVEKEYVFEGEKRKGNAGRSLCRTQPACCLPLHVWAGVEGGLSWMLVHGRSHRWSESASAAS